MDTLALLHDLRFVKIGYALINTNNKPQFVRWKDRVFQRVSYDKFPIRYQEVRIQMVQIKE